jgi:hypothetical protein
MSQRIILMLAVLGFCLIPGVQAANIVLINQEYDTDADGVQDDQGLIDWLVAEGHTVDVQPGNWVDLDPNKMAVLDAADLVIMSRASNSGDYASNADEVTLWNSVKAPLIQMSAYLVRSSRWKWVNSTSISNPVGAMTEAVDLESPVFRFVTLEPNNPDDPNDPAVLVQAVDGTTGTGQTSLIGTLDMGNGHLIAKGAGLDAAWIATWEPGVEFYEGAGEMPAAKRMMFCAGTQEVGATPQGAFNLTADGEQMLHNAINYMLGKSLVVWVSFHEADDVASAGAAGAGFTEAADKGYTDLLEGAGYDVMRMVQTGNPDLSIVNAADLVIISRSVASSSFQGDNATRWNTAVTSPMMVMSGYTTRSSRMGYNLGTTIPDTTGDITLTAADPNHPIFAGVSLADGTMVNPYAGVVSYADGTLARGISIVTDPLDDEATVLATVSAASAETGPVDAAVIAELPAGATLQHDGGAGTDVLAGRRMLFLSGAREADGISSETAGMIDLYDDGAQMFLNAVAYMLIEPEAPADPLAEGLLLHYPFDEDASDASGNGNDGTLLGDAVILDGVLVLDGDDDAVDVPRLGGEDAVYGQCSISMWVFATADLTPMQFAGGINTNGWTGGAVHFKLSYGMVNAGINGLDGGDLQGVTPVMPAMWSHMVLTVSDTEVALYLNGQLEDSRALEAPLEGLILGGAALGAWNNGGDIQREMPGLMDEVRIYDRALSADEVAELGSL